MPKSLRALRFAPVVLVAAVLFPILRGTLPGTMRGAIASASAAESSAGGAPTGLTCEAMEQPLGIGVTQSRLSWRVNDSRRGALQTAYEIQVASSLERLALGHADVWDSGKVESSESVNVAYGGPSVASRRRYYWQVRVWDADGKTSPYSTPSWWEMGLLLADDWKAQWITRDLPLERGDYESRPKWIWTAKEEALSKASVGKRDFRFSFDLAQKPKTAVLLITGKDNIAVWVNGKAVLEASPMSKFKRPRDPWGTFHQVDASNLDAGKNSIAAEVTTYQPEWAKAPVAAGFIAMLRVEMPDGKVQRIISNADWKTIEGQSDAAWTAKDFDAAAWPNASVAAEIGESALGTPWTAEPISWLGRDFTLTKAVRSARIYSTALGTYQLYLNGARVGDDILAPGWTDYRKRIVYQVYDVTHALRTGANSLQAILAGGWYGDGLGWLQNRYNFGPPPVRFMGQLEIEYADGTRETIGTDETWKATSSAILKSDIYNGEAYDARLEKSKGWRAGFDRK